MWWMVVKEIKRQRESWVDKAGVNVKGLNSDVMGMGKNKFCFCQFNTELHFCCG